MLCSRLCCGFQNFSFPSHKRELPTGMVDFYNRIPYHFNSKLLVCSAHFTTDSFSNLGQYQAGFAHRLILKKGAVPTNVIFPLQPLPQAESNISDFIHYLTVEDISVSEISENNLKYINAFYSTFKIII